MMRVFIHYDCVQTQRAADENEVEDARLYFYWAMQGLSFSLIWFFGILSITVIAASICLCLSYYNTIDYKS